MQKFIEKQLPTDISYGSEGGPEYNTEVLKTTSGAEFRTCKLQTPKMVFNISMGIKNKEQIDRITRFFRVCKGREIGFRYKDWSDFKGENEIVQKINDNSFQLIKTYKLDDTVYEKRMILKPVKNTVKIYFSGELLPANQFTVDCTTGIVTIDSSINTKNVVVTADFEFDIPVRFDTDYLPVTIGNHGFFSLPEIPVVEITI